MEFKLNAQQKKAVEHGDGPLLIVAGAGTGKTAVITQRIAWLIKSKKLQPDNILALTFTEKAAAEMEERVDKQLPYGYVDLWISTFHAFAQRLLADHALDIGLPPQVKLLDQTAAWLLVREHLADFPLDYYRPLGSPNKFIHALLQHFSRAKDELIMPNDYLAYAEQLQLDADNAGWGAVRKGKGKQAKLAAVDKEIMAQEATRVKEVAEAYHFYQKLLLDNEAMDFGDLLTYVIRLLKERPAILQKYREQFPYILVDEFQDTNFAQYELIKLLAAPTNNITVVGDDDQSIYKFRGASISNIMEFKKDFPKAEEVYLTINYRSRQNILDLAYKFIQLNNPERLEVKLARADGKPLTKKLKAAGKIPGQVESYFASSLELEVNWVMEKIVNIYNSDEQIGWNDFAILVRANDHAEPFLQAMQDRQLPHYYLASRGLYQKEVVRNIIAYLQLLDDYHESKALWRILNMSVWQLATADLVKLSHFASRKQWSLWEALTKVGGQIQYPTETVVKFSKVVEQVRKHTALARQQRVWPVVRTWLEDSGYLSYLDNLPEAARLEHFNYLNSFYKKIKIFDSENDQPNVKNFVSQINFELLSGEQGNIEFDPNIGPETIKVMTVHSAKGLEFSYVFVVNLVDQRFPSNNRAELISLPDALVKEPIPEGDMHLAEERRLFYVAMTRAKHGLYLTGGADYGGSRRKKPSRFLVETGLDKGSEQPTVDLLSETEPVKKSSSFNYKQLLPPRFSFSQLRTFAACPWQYYYQYILKVPGKGNHYTSYGKSMHSALQHWFEFVQQRSRSVQTDLFTNQDDKNQVKTDKPLATVDELVQLLEDNWLDDWFTDAQQQQKYLRQGKESLRVFYDSIKDNIPVPLALEKGFLLKIDGHTVKGVIDRIDEQPDGSIRIIDYKTGKSKTSEKLNADDKRQLLLYQLAGQEVLGRKVGELTFYYLDNNQPASFLGTDKELDKLRLWVTKTIESIINMDWSRLPEHHCQWCDPRDSNNYIQT
ncbi:MAG: ATP-dependent helicase [Candidatus Komeilibacteria bacterium]